MIEHCCNVINGWLLLLYLKLSIINQYNAFSLLQQGKVYEQRPFLSQSSPF